MNDITVQELKEKQKKGDSFNLIDVREPFEYEEFNLGGKLYPLGTIMQLVEDYEDQKDVEMVVYCRSGARSGQAKLFLEQAGFTKVRNLLGGVLAWQDTFGS